MKPRLGELERAAHAQIALELLKRRFELLDIGRNVAAYVAVRCEDLVRAASRAVLLRLQMVDVEAMRSENIGQTVQQPGAVDAGE